MARFWIAPSSAATALVTWLCVGGSAPADRALARELFEADLPALEAVAQVPPPPENGGDPASEGGADPDATRPDLLARVDSVFEARTTLRAKIAICAEAGRHGCLRCDEGRIWSFAQGVAGDAQFRIDAWDLILKEQDPDMLLWLGHWLDHGLLGPEPGARRTGMIPLMLYGEPWQRRLAAVRAACTHLGDPLTRPPDTVWSALRSVLADESHPAVLLAAVGAAASEPSAADLELLFRAVSRLGAVEERASAAKAVARGVARLAEASRLFDLATTEAERSLWLRALAAREPPHEEQDPESAAVFARLYRGADPQGRLALLQSPVSGSCLKTTLQGLLADDEAPASRERLAALLAPRRR